MSRKKANALRDLSFAVANIRRARELLLGIETPLDRNVPGGGRFLMDKVLADLDIARSDVQEIFDRVKVAP